MENDTREGAQTSETRTAVFSLLSTDNIPGLWQHHAQLADRVDMTAPNTLQLYSLGSFFAQNIYHHLQNEETFFSFSFSRVAFFDSSQFFFNFQLIKKLHFSLKVHLFFRENCLCDT